MRNCHTCLFRISDPGFCINGCPNRNGHLSNHGRTTVSMDASGTPSPEVESAAARQAEERARPYATDEEAAVAERRVRLMQIIGDAVRGYEDAAGVVADAKTILGQLSDLGADEVRLLFMMMGRPSVNQAAAAMGIPHQRAYEMKKSILAKHPEFRGVFRI